jgi:hypothetical protein
MRAKFELQKLPQGGDLLEIDVAAYARLFGVLPRVVDGRRPVGNK